jgi:hypothetical protein
MPHEAGEKQNRPALSSSGYSDDASPAGAKDAVHKTSGPYFWNPLGNLASSMAAAVSQEKITHRLEAPIRNELTIAG